jgi:S1-C subfamily serine protease
VSRRRKQGAILALAAWSVTLAGCAPSSATTPFADSFEPSTTILEQDAQRTARRVTYRIRTIGCSTLATGSGFAIDAYTIVTNRHVVEDAVRISVSSWDGREIAVAASAISQDRDLAIIKTDAALPGWGTLGDGKVGDGVWVIGYPEGNKINVSTGEITAEVDGDALTTDGKTAESAMVWQVSAKVVQGNSGGPLVGPDGSIVGVVFGYGRDSGSGYAIQSPGVRALLQTEVTPVAKDCPL